MTVRLCVNCSLKKRRKKRLAVIISTFKIRKRFYLLITFGASESRWRFWSKSRRRKSVVYTFTFWLLKFLVSCKWWRVLCAWIRMASRLEWWVRVNRWSSHHACFLVRYQLCFLYVYSTNQVYAPLCTRTPNRFKCKRKVLLFKHLYLLGLIKRYMFLVFIKLIRSVCRHPDKVLDRNSLLLNPPSKTCVPTSNTILYLH